MLKKQLKFRTKSTTSVPGMRVKQDGVPVSLLKYDDPRSVY